MKMCHDFWCVVLLPRVGSTGFDIAAHLLLLGCFIALAV